MKFFFILIALFFSTHAHAFKNVFSSSKSNPRLNITTSLGIIQIDVLKQREGTADYFLKSAHSGIYNGTIFHRIIDGFVLQGGIYDVNFKKKNISTEAVEEEPKGKFKNSFATIALIRDPQNHELLTNQFFINLANNTFLDEPDHRTDYDVFGIVTGGFDVLQKIAHVKIGQREGLYNVPFYPNEVVIQSIETAEKHENLKK